MSGITFSGDPGTTGREVFEDSTASGPGGKYTGQDTTTYTGQGGAGPGIGGGLHGQHGTGIATTGNDSHGNHLHGPGAHHEGSAVRDGEDGHVHSEHCGHHERQHQHHEDGHVHSENCGHHERQHQHHEGGLGAAGTTGALGAQGVTAGERHHHHSEPHHHSITGAGNDNERPTDAIADRTGPGGPVSSGAPTGGERASGAHETGLEPGHPREGLHGDLHTFGTGHTDRGDSTSGLTGKNTMDSVDHSTERAEGKSTGGVGGVLATSDKDFTGRDRLPNPSTSAYTDDSGIHKSNTSGPGGASALTGREGNLENNPIAQRTDDVSGVHGRGVTGTHAGANDQEGLRNTSGPAGHSVSGEGVNHGETEHKGFVQKIKDML